MAAAQQGVFLSFVPVAACLFACYFDTVDAKTDYGVPGLAPKRFPKNAGPDGRAVRTNLNPLMGAQTRRTSDDRFGGAPRAPPVPSSTDPIERTHAAEAQARAQPAAASDPVPPVGSFTPKPRRSRFAAPVPQGSTQNAPVGAARRVLSQPGFPSRPMMPREASDPLHSNLAQPDPFSTGAAFGAAGIPGGRSRFAGRGQPKRQEGPRIHPNHGRSATRQDDMPRQSIGAIDNTDKSFIPGITSPTSDKAKAAAARVAARAPPDTESKPANEMVTLEGASHYEPALGEMLYHLRLHNTHQSQFTGLLIVTTSLPHGSKPEHSYWIRNRKRNIGEKAEQHDCVVKRLTITCKVHKLAPGQLATIYLHNKQRETGLSPAHTSVTADGKVRATTSL